MNIPSSSHKYKDKLESTLKRIKFNSSAAKRPFAKTSNFKDS